MCRRARHCRVRVWGQFVARFSDHVLSRACDCLYFRALLRAFSFARFRALLLSRLSRESCAHSKASSSARASRACSQFLGGVLPLDQGLINVNNPSEALVLALAGISYLSHSHLNALKKPASNSLLGRPHVRGASRSFSKSGQLVLSQYMRGALAFDRCTFCPWTSLD
eukprot:3043320-Pleurochrysis_carterae.AAC.2